jgi:hypothetical protein
LFPDNGVVVSGKLASDGTFAGMEQISLQGVEPRVPLQFTSASTTPLKYEFKEGPNDITISLDNPPSVKANSTEM